MKAGVIDEEKNTILFLESPKEASSPLNIYLHEFDKYILSDIKSPIELINLKQDRTLSGKQHPTTGHLRYILRSIRKQILNILYSEKKKKL